MSTDDVTKLATSSPVLLAALDRMHRSENWMTAAEIGQISAASFTAMAKRTPAWVERRMARWGGEQGQKHGRGYEYRLTPHGRALKAVRREQLEKARTAFLADA
jgi:hypothetical protein